MRETYDKALKAVLVYEGGFVNHPKDPGGATNFGITQKVYDGYRSRNGQVKQSVKRITMDEVGDIYRPQYWKAVRGDELPVGVDFVVFDGSVNSGPKQSIKWLQRALGVTADGVLGMMTMAALANVADYDALIAKIIARREAFLRSLKTFSTFGKGWMARINNVLKVGQAWASGSVGPDVVAAPDAGVKAMIEDAKAPPPKVAGDIATGTGLGTAGVTGTVQTLQETLTPFSSSGGWITKLVITLAIISAVLTIAGLAWRWYASRKTDKLKDALDADATRTAVT